MEKKMMYSEPELEIVKLRLSSRVLLAISEPAPSIPNQPIDNPSDPSDPWGDVLP